MLKNKEWFAHKNTAVYINHYVHMPDIISFRPLILKTGTASNSQREGRTEYFVKYSMLFS